MADDTRPLYNSPEERQAVVMTLRKQGYKNAEVAGLLDMDIKEVTQDVSAWVRAVIDTMPTNNELYLIHHHQLLNKMTDWQDQYLGAKNRLKLSPRSKQDLQAMAMATSNFLSVQKQLNDFLGLKPKKDPKVDPKKEEPTPQLDLWEHLG